VVEPNALDAAQLDTMVETLAAAAACGDRQMMDVILTELIPTFAPMPAGERR